jgi:hypothetical protein
VLTCDYYLQNYNKCGVNLLSNVCDFTWGLDCDCPAPKAFPDIPKPNGVINVAVNTNIQIYFDRVLNPYTINSNTFYLTVKGSTSTTQVIGEFTSTSKVPGSIIWQHYSSESGGYTTATFDPYGIDSKNDQDGIDPTMNLTCGTRYEVHLTSEIRNWYGGKALAYTKFEFTTVTCDAIQFFPTGGLIR